MRHEDERETLIRPSTTVPDVERRTRRWSAVDAVDHYHRAAGCTVLRRTCGSRARCCRYGAVRRGAVAGRSREMTTTSSALGSSNGKGKGRCDPPRKSPRRRRCWDGHRTMRARKLYESDDADDVAFERAVYECMNVPTGHPWWCRRKGEETVRDETERVVRGYPCTCPRRRVLHRGVETNKTTKTSRWDVRRI